MLRVLQQFILTTFLAVFASQASAMFIQSDWFDPTQPGVGTNRYSYSFNDPINNRDPNGNEMEPLYNSRLRELVYVNNSMRMVSQGRLSQMTGTVFEGAVLRSMGIQSNADPVASDLRGQLTRGIKNYVVPDAIGATTVTRPNSVLGVSHPVLGM